MFHVSVFTVAVLIMYLKLASPEFTMVKIILYALSAIIMFLSPPFTILLNFCVFLLALQRLLLYFFIDKEKLFTFSAICTTNGSPVELGIIVKILTL
ncbi:unnamed protein product [Caenorhabditis bovis]|uniref:Uncharacterized protein n=1 Tax=Caenorhabditis bovis TaxID=2654633 RepID=A0A8S1F2W1_9PELO|nr:unnamed protein product [Caenorhabditis bovis]